MKSENKSKFLIIVSSSKWKEKFGEIVERKFHSFEPIKVKEFDENDRIIGETIYSSKGKLLRKNLTLRDSLNKITQEVSFDEDGSILSKEEYKYDEKGNELEYSYYNKHFNKEGEFQRRRLNNYNKNGKLEEGTSYTAGKQDFKNIYKYDQNGNTIEELHYGSEDILMSRCEFRYDENGNKIEKYKSELDFDPETLDQIWKSIKVEWKYDKNGNKIETCVYDENGALKSRKEIKRNENDHKITDIEYNVDIESKAKDRYDENGNKIETCLYDENGELESRLEYKYDENNNIIDECEYNENGELKSRIERRYNKEIIAECNTYQSGGELVKIEKYNGQGMRTEEIEKNKVIGSKTYGEVIRFYKYDPEGRLIQQLILGDGSPIQLIEYKVVFTQEKASGFLKSIEPSKSKSIFKRK